MRGISLWARGLQAFVIAMPFLHALGLSQWLPLPLVLAATMLLLALLLGAMTWIWLEKSDLLLFGTLAMGFFALVLQHKYVGQKNWNHGAALIVTVTVFYIWMRAWIWHASLDFESLGAAATLSLMIASTAVLFEFWLANSRGIYLADILPYSSKELPFPTVLESARRPRGLASEPGFSAMLFEALGPLALYHLRKHRLLAYLCMPVIVLGFVLLFSAGAMSAMLLSLLIVFALQRRIPFRFVAITLGALGIAVLVLGLGTFVWALDEIIGRKIFDLFIKGNVNLGEAAGRYEAYRVALSMFLSHPFGIGWGMVSQMYATDVILPGLSPIESRGLLSLYWEILVSAGALGFASYVAFHISKILAIWRLQHAAMPYVLFGALSLSLHHAFVLEFWFPMIWFYFALASCFQRDPRALRFGAKSLVQEVGMPNGNPH